MKLRWQSYFRESCKIANFWFQQVMRSRHQSLARSSSPHWTERGQRQDRGRGRGQGQYRGRSGGQSRGRGQGRGRGSNQRGYRSTSVSQNRQWVGRSEVKYFFLKN